MMTQEPITRDRDRSSQTEAKLPADLGLPLDLELVDRVSIGGMGAVYEARSRKSGLRLAVKVLLPRYLEDDVKRRRFLLEGKAVESLSSAHVVRVFDYGVTGADVPYLVMEYADGGTLTKRVNNALLTVDEAIDVFLQVADGLEHAHEAGILHRDLKPSNIMFGSQEGGAAAAKLLDFGIAKFTHDSSVSSESLTQTGDVIGTPLFMSPEQCCGREVDARSDIYSLGCVIYWSVTRQFPADGETIMEIFGSHATRVPDLEPVDKKLRPVIMRCLEKNPADRYQTAKELREDLVRLKRTGRIAFRLTGRQKAQLRGLRVLARWLFISFVVSFAVVFLLSAFGVDLF